MTTAHFDSYAQNGEDVVLWRALGPEVDGPGRYLDIGANDPVVDSITWSLYQRGWRGITAEPVPELAAAHRALRPEDVQFEGVVGALDADEVVLHEIAGTGLSTIEGDIAQRHASRGLAVAERTVPVRRLDELVADAGWGPDDPVHLLVVDTEGSELAVLESIDLRVVRPWVLVVESTAPASDRPTHAAWEGIVTGAGYRFCFFDGLSRYYVADEHADALGHRLSYPPCALDDFDTRQVRQLTQERDEARADAARTREELTATQERVAGLVAEAVRWRTAALTRWAQAAGGASAYSVNSELGQLRHEVEAMRRTVSWRVTRPLRAVRSRAGVWRARR